jgi:molybdenum cofactor biosynthesis protein B
MNHPASSQPAKSASTQEHRAAAPDSVTCAVLTVSDTRTEETDVSGKIIRDLMVAAGHTVVDYIVVRDEPDQIRQQMNSWIQDPAIQVILSDGGTGIAARDTTFDAIVSLLEKRIDGFGELFRMLSYEEIGAAAMLSRATAGVANRTVIMSMPGSRNAVTLAMEKLIVPEITHVVYEVNKDLINSDATQQGQNA